MNRNAEEIRIFNQDTGYKDQQFQPICRDVKTLIDKDFNFSNQDSENDVSQVTYNPNSLNGFLNPDELNELLDVLFEDDSDNLLGNSYQDEDETDDYPGNSPTETSKRKNLKRPISSTPEDTLMIKKNH